MNKCVFTQKILVIYKSTQLFIHLCITVYILLTLKLDV